MGPAGGFGGSVKFADGKTSSANVPHLNVWGFDISAAEFPQPKKTCVFGVNRPLGPIYLNGGPLGPIHTKDARFFCCGNSAAVISKSHTFKWDPLADDVLEAA